MYYLITLYRKIHAIGGFLHVGVDFTFNFALSTVTNCQLSVEKAMASRAADTNENMEAKHNVTALQNAILNDE